jgi:aminoglycoside 6'-N-acetyltransferase
MAAEVIAVTEHLVLRPMASGDAPALAAYRNDPVQARYQSWQTPYPVDSAQALITEMREVRFAQPGAWLQVAIETAGRLIGDVAVRVDRDDPRQAEIGFTLAADAQGHGFATEAVRAVMSLLFNEHGIHRITADCDTRNVRSAALLERVGMRREAHHRTSAWWKGEWTDEYVYAILAEEWRDEERGSP